VSLLNVVVFSTVYSSSPTADAIHYGAITPAAAAICDFNRIPAFAGIHTVLVVLLSLLFLLLHAFLLLWAFMILLSSLLLLVAGATVVACIQTVAGILAVAGVLLVPDGFWLLVSLLLLALLVLLDFLSNYRTMAIGLLFFSAIGLSDIGSRPQFIGQSDIGHRKNYRLPTSARENVL
jgi:hypothetical protein